MGMTARFVTYCCGRSDADCGEMHVAYTGSDRVRDRGGAGLDRVRTQLFFRGEEGCFARVAGPAVVLPLVAGDRLAEGPTLRSRMLNHAA